MYDEKNRINPNVSVRQRDARKKTWENSLRLLSSEVSGPSKDRVDDTIKFFDDKVCSGTPIIDESGEHYGVNRDGNEQSIGLVALFASDSILHPGLKRRIDSSLFQYVEAVRSVIIPPKQLSRRWMGIVLFHEMRHAMNHVEGAFRGQTDANWFEEQSIYRDEHEIIRTIYGDRYIDVVESEAKDLSISMTDEGNLPRDRLVMSADRVLVEALEKPKYAFEDNIRRAATMLDLGFTVLTHIGKSGPRDFAMFTKSMGFNHEYLGK